MTRIGMLTLAALGVLLGACGRHPVYTYRYKLTLEALAGGELRRASSVVQQTQQMTWQLGPGQMLSAGLKGEALYLDLAPKCRPLVALMSVLQDYGSDNDFGWTPHAGVFLLERLYGLPPMRWEHDKLVGWETFARQRGARELTPYQLPQLVTFIDVANPKTVREVDPKDPGPDLGCDFKWLRMTIEVTDDPVTTGIEKRLPWLKAVYPNRLDGQRYESVDAANRFANRLSASSFSTEIRR